MKWNIDTAHSSAGFKVRHLGISNVRGEFSSVTGTVTTDESGQLTGIQASIPVASVNTGNEARDEHLRGADFFDAAQFPTIEFVGTSMTPSRSGHTVTGDLTMHGVTRSITFQAEVSEPVTDPVSGKHKLGGEASLTLSRKDYGLTWNAAIETGGVMVSDEVHITLELQAVED